MFGDKLPSGLRVRLHFTWYIGFILVTLAVSTQFPEAYRLWQKISLGLLGSVLFLMAILLREAALYILAVRRGVPARRLTLFVFGAVSNPEAEVPKPVLDLLMGVAGLISNLFIAVIFYFFYLITIASNSLMVGGIIQWLDFLVMMLALLHFLPVYPLDGGKVLRAFIWHFSGKRELAYSATRNAGLFVGLAFLIWGLLLALNNELFSGVALMFLGWTMTIAVRFNRRQATLLKALKGVTAGKVARACPVVHGDLTLRALVNDWVLDSGQSCFIVSNGRGFEGLVTLDNIKAVPLPRWGSTPVSAAMTPAGRIGAAESSETAISLLERMTALNISQLPVLDGEKVEGIVSRESLLHLARIRSRLGNRLASSSRR